MVVQVEIQPKVARTKIKEREYKENKQREITWLFLSIIRFP